MSNETSTVNIGIGGLLCLIFIVLKLTGVIHWSWLWVLSPLWIGLALAVLFALIIVAVALAGKLK